MIAIIRNFLLTLLSFSTLILLGQVDFGKVEIVEAETAAGTDLLPPHHHKITVV